jgi:PAS domain S-box-containing protein
LNCLENLQVSESAIHRQIDGLMSATSNIVPFPPDADDVGTLTPLSELITANRQRDALYALSERLHHARSTDEIYSAATDAIESALGCDRCSILLFDDAGVMQFVAWHGLSSEYRAAVVGHTPWTQDEHDATPIAISDVNDSELEPSLKATVLGEQIFAAAFIPLVVEKRVIGKFMAYFREPFEFSPEDLAVALSIARQMGFAIQRQRGADSLAHVLGKLESREKELADELEATRLLQALSLEIAQEVDAAALNEKLVDAAQVIMRSDYASMQRFHPDLGQRGELELLATRGFDPAATKFWKWVRADSACSCGQVLKTSKRAVIPDVEKCPNMAGTPDLVAYRNARIASVQSTPLLARDGRLVGMISTHWAQTHTPSERDLRLLDILARLAADFMERQVRLEDLRRREERSRTLTQLLSDVPWQARSDGAFEELQPAWENYTGQSWEAHAGHGWLEAIHADDRDAMRASWSAACFEARPFEHTARIWHARTHQYRRCILRATPIRHEDGSVREWVGACLDVHAQPGG